jgi:hypothetical protein
MPKRFVAFAVAAVLPTIASLQEAMLTTRRQRMQERHERLHNPVARKNGADLNALAQQVSLALLNLIKCTWH